jgi:uncharacterized protein YjbI with pentapeptide repeats
MVMRLIARSIIIVVLVGCFVAAVAGAEEQECESPYKGLTLTPEELETVLHNHQTWLEALEAGVKPNDERRANLCQAVLEKANLQRARLEVADLQGARLFWTNLQGARLQRANLQEADLNRADLQGARLFQANLQGARLEGANLQEAHLGEANLQEANLARANLQRAHLEGANLQGALGQNIGTHYFLEAYSIPLALSSA